MKVFDENEQLKKDIAALEERKKLVEQRALLEKELKEKAEFENKLTGTVKRGGFNFTPKDDEYFRQFDATGQEDKGGNRNFYQCIITKGNRDFVTIVGQTFAKEEYKRRDGICPRCEREELQSEEYTGSIVKIPIQAGDFNAKCPVCGSKLKYTSPDYKELPVHQNYTISGELIFRIAIKAHEKVVKVLMRDPETKEESGFKPVPCINFIKCVLVKVNKSSDIIMQREVDLRKIKKHYDNTAIKDNAGNIITEGEKRIFFKQEEIKEIIKDKDVFALI
jgi:hypothetical protein